MIATNKAALKRKNAALARRVETGRKRVKVYKTKAGDLKREVSRLRKRVDELEHGMVFEPCPNCDSQVEMRWSVKDDGFKAYCPYCGGRLMLCDECQHQGDDGEYTGGCDYDYGTDSCKYNPRRTAEI